MAKRFVVPFAATGDKTTTPDATDPAGAVSYSQGWPVAYQLPDTDPNYRPVGRQEMNGVLFDITGAIAELQTLGFPEWVAVTGLVTPYAINAWVRRLNNVYFNTVANNSAAPEATNSGWVNIATLIPGRVLRQIRYDVSGTYTPLAAMASVVMELRGAGGGAGGSPATSATQFGVAGGAGGGARAVGRFVAAQIGASQTVTVGIGGGGGTGSSPGANGGTTSVGAVISASGGLGGLATTISTTTSNIAPGTQGGTTTNNANLISEPGQAGGVGVYIGGSYRGGIGGGPSGNVGGVITDTISPAGGLGSGGSGHAVAPSTSARTGGAGGNGYVLITEYS